MFIMKPNPCILTIIPNLTRVTQRHLKCIWGGLDGDILDRCQGTCRDGAVVTTYMSLKSIQSDSSISTVTRLHDTRSVTTNQGLSARRRVHSDAIDRDDLVTRPKDFRSWIYVSRLHCHPFEFEM